MVLSSVITIMLYATTEFYNNGKGESKIKSHDIEIGGMNDTEFHDIKKIANPTHEYDNFGTWSANWKLETCKFSKENENIIPRLAYPPLKYVAPFLSRIKSWGYKITFYENYQYTLGRNTPGSYPEHVIPSLVHLWILERTSELRMLPPAPPRKTTTVPTTILNSKINLDLAVGNFPSTPELESTKSTIIHPTTKLTTVTPTTAKIASGKDIKPGVGRAGSGKSDGSGTKSAMASSGNLEFVNKSSRLFLICSTIIYMVQIYAI